MSFSEEKLKPDVALNADAEYGQGKIHTQSHRTSRTILSLASAVCLILTGALLFSQDTSLPFFGIQQQGADQFIGRWIWAFPWPGHGDNFHWGPCKGVSDKRFKCGYLDVPLDYTNKSDTRKIRLATNVYQPGRFKSKQTIITNPGGPGGEQLS